MTTKSVTYTPLSSGLSDPKLNFDPLEVTVIKAATPRDAYRKLVDKAGSDPAEMMKAATWALKKDLMLEFHDAIKKVLELDPKHEVALRIKELKQALEQPLPANPDTEKDLRTAVGRPNMKVFSSKHFLLLCDTPDKTEKGHRRNRANARLVQLEQVFESFMYLFQTQGIQLDIPQEPMKVVLFNDTDDFKAIVAGLSQPPTCASGYWDSNRNISYFCDHGASEMFKVLEKKHEDQKLSDPSRTTGDTESIRKAKIIDILLGLERENCDMAAVSHVAPLQIAGNTGLLPHQVEMPRWVQQGFASYFEVPSDAPWAGMGAVTEARLKHYDDFKDDPLHTNLDFIVGDQFFNYCRSIKSDPVEYAQAWSLMHFLMENHWEKCIALFRKLGEMPADVALNPDLVLDSFSQVFGSNRKALEGEWRSYARSLTTDLERLEAAAK